MSRPRTKSNPARSTKQAIQAHEEQILGSFKFSWRQRLQILFGGRLFYNVVIRISRRRRGDVKIEHQRTGAAVEPVFHRLSWRKRVLGESE